MDGPRNYQHGHRESKRVKEIRQKTFDIHGEMILRSSVVPPGCNLCGLEVFGQRSGGCLQWREAVCIGFHYYYFI